MFSKFPAKGAPRTARKHNENAAIDVAGGVNFRIQNQSVASDAHGCEFFSRVPVQQARQKDMTFSAKKECSCQADDLKEKKKQDRFAPHARMRNSKNKKHETAS